MVVVADQLMYTGVQAAPVGAEDDIEKLQSFASRYVMSQPLRLSASSLFSEKPRRFMQLTDIIFNPAFQDSKSTLYDANSLPSALVKEERTLTWHALRSVPN